MPAAPLTQDIATPRRRIGGRCRKWAVSTQQPTDKRRCASNTICGSQFAHGEARLQQWCHRDSHNAYVHDQCINGGVAHDSELHPKTPTDQDAVGAVTRQRDCITQAAADSEVLLPIATGSDQASTAAPTDDDQRGRCQSHCTSTRLQHSGRCRLRYPPSPHCEHQASTAAPADDEVTCLVVKWPFDWTRKA